MLNTTTIELFLRIWADFKVKMRALWETDVFYVRSRISQITEFYQKVKEPVQSIIKEWTKKGLAITTVIAGLAVFVLLPPSAATSAINTGPMYPTEDTIVLLIENMQNDLKDYGILPIAEEAEPRQTFTIPMTAYASLEGQTDDTPCITASGLDVCERNIENVVAANFLPLGTKVRIPELFGDRIFYVEDRMNSRYYYKMDFWFIDNEDAKEFGLKFATVEVF